MNKCQCRLCGDIIESKERHDYVRCKCGEIFTDGGDDYLHRGAKNLKNIIDCNSEEFVDPNQYSCDICGERHDWDEINWVTSGVGLCEPCYQKNVTKKTCPKCSNTLFKSDLPGYKYVCYECDENFYGTEVG